MSAQLNFEIENQIITRTDSFQPVAKSQNYLRASFTFSDDWGNDDKIAIFKIGGKSYEVILDAEGECVVPWEVLVRVGTVYVSAYSGDRVTASVAKVPVLKTGYVDDPTSTEDPSVDIYQQLKAQIQDVQDDIPEIVDDALSNAKLSDFDNDAGFITESDIPTPNWEAVYGEDGYITNKPKIMAGTGTGSLRNSKSTAGGNYSFAEGNGCSASGDYAHSEGELTKAVKNGSHAEGYSTVTSGSYSHAEGAGTIANHKSQHVFGEYNIVDPGRNASTTRGTYVEIVGNGVSSDAKSNARTLDWEGNQWIAGNMKVGGTGYDDPNAKEVATKDYVDDAIADIPTESEIDDTAGSGDTDKTWSADKITSELANAGSVQDVTINGTSVVSNGVAEIPVASGNNQFGLIKASNSYGTNVYSSGVISVSAAPSASVKAGNNGARPICCSNQHESVFYGLSKAAGVDLANETVTLGTYPDNAKASIKAMLGVGGETQKVTVSGTAPVIVANQNTRYVCGEIVSLDFTPSAEGICDVIFTSGSTVTVLTIPNTVRFPEWFDPTSLEANKTYEISISDGVYGAVMIW